MSHTIKCDACGKEFVVASDNYWTLDANQFLLSYMPNTEEMMMGGVPYHFCSLEHLAIWATARVKVAKIEAEQRSRGER